MPWSALPRVGGESKRKRRSGKRKKKDKMQSKGVEGLRARLVADCCHKIDEPGVLGCQWSEPERPWVLQTPSRAGTSMAPAQSLGFGSSEAMGWGASIRPSGQCASNLQKVQTDFSRPHLIHLRANSFPQARGVVDIPPSSGSVAPLGATDAADAPGRRERLVSGRQESLDVCNAELTNRMYICTEHGIFCPLTD